ncbi:MAG TPA: tripartite tricarboxylate transporter substrate-binding protein [Kiloniellales bacterium]|nr:tripartite tricarboxylate transporter substrate-binding protein [Kiloniellales bacterium]
MKLRDYLGKGLAIAALSAAIGLASDRSEAAGVEDVYSGETLTIMIGHPPGGSYDLYAQLAAAFIGEHIPGNPNVIVQHMPGGGGRKGAAFFINNVEPDGLTVGIFPDTLGHIQQLRPKQADWDASKFRYIGRFAPANAAFAVRKGAPATTVDEMRNTEIIVACTGKSSRSAQQPAALKNVGGLKLRLICGYKGSEAAKLATLRGEADMFSQNWASFKSDYAHIESGELKIVLQAGLERDPELPNVPLLLEVTDDPEAKRILRYVSAGAPVGRSMMAHPDTSEEIIAALREAFQSMISDPAFLAEAKKRQAIIDPAPGEEIEAIMAEIMSASPELIAAAQKAMDTSDAGEATN